MLRAILIIQLCLWAGMLYGQCDSIVMGRQAPKGLKVNVQSHVSNVPSDQDLEICMVLSTQKDYSFEVIGHREFEVFILTTRSLNGTRTDRTEKKVLFTNKEEKNGTFTIRTEKVHQLYFRLIGVPDEQGNECTGIMVYEKE